MRKLLIIFLPFLLLYCKSAPAPFEVVSEPVPGIEILNPEFNVKSIYVIQADIVVTEFEAVIKINNPNHFAVELSSISYELFGDGRLWASGKGGNLRYADSPAGKVESFKIAANSSGEARFFFSMNFTNMSRALLDDVIAMRQINYHFKGSAQILPDLKNAASFDAGFDCSGLSEVKRKSDK